MSSDPREFNKGDHITVTLKSGAVVQGEALTTLRFPGLATYQLRIAGGVVLDLNVNYDIPLSHDEVDALLNPPAPKGVTGNTHYAVISTSMPPSMEVVAGGPEAHCRAVLDTWIKNHPLGEFETGEVLQTVHRVPNPSDELTDLLGMTPATAAEAALLRHLRRLAGVDES